jgi:hypothetical protein
MQRKKNTRNQQISKSRHPRVTSQNTADTKLRKHSHSEAARR